MVLGFHEATCQDYFSSALPTLWRGQRCCVPFCVINVSRNFPSPLAFHCFPTLFPIALLLECQGCYVPCCGHKSRKTTVIMIERQKKSRCSVPFLAQFYLFHNTISFRCPLGPSSLPNCIHS